MPLASFTWVSSCSIFSSSFRALFSFTFIPLTEGQTDSLLTRVQCCIDCQEVFFFFWLNNGKLFLQHSIIMLLSTEPSCSSWLTELSRLILRLFEVPGESDLSLSSATFSTSSSLCRAVVSLSWAWSRLSSQHCRRRHRFVNSPSACKTHSRENQPTPLINSALCLCVCVCVCVCGTERFMSDLYESGVEWVSVPCSQRRAGRAAQVAHRPLHRNYFSSRIIYFKYRSNPHALLRAHTGMDHGWVKKADKW